MTIEAQLIGAVVALWGVLTTVVGGAVKFLLDDRKTLAAAWEKRLIEERSACSTRVTAMEVKLDQSSDVIRRQNDSLQKQLDAQATLMAQQQQMIVALQTLGRGSAS